MQAKRKAKRQYEFFYKPEHEDRCNRYPCLTRNGLAYFLGIEREELDKLRVRGRILGPTGKNGRAPKWKRTEVIQWLKAGGPSREDWAEWKDKKRFGGE